jgi:hypothetical protein
MGVAGWLWRNPQAEQALTKAVKKPELKICALVKKP